MSQQILEQVLGEVKALRATQETQRITQEAHAAEIKKLSEPRSGRRAFMDGAPHARSGEDALGSRGYSFLKFLGYCAGQVTAENAKVEIDVHNRMQKALVERGGYVKASPNTMLMPSALCHLGLGDDHRFVSELGDLISAGINGVDMDEVAHYREKYWGREKAMSWQVSVDGGNLVGPAVQGELITLLRNNAALLKAGAREIGMSPTGRTVFPRQTGTCTSYWMGENDSTGGVTESQPTTGDLTLQAKKLVTLVRLPNELFRFVTPSIDQFVREDIAQSMALKFDLTLLEGKGSTVAPKGLLNYDITNHIAATVHADGNTFAPEDVADMIGKVEEKNADFKAWIMRPLMYSKIANRRYGSGYSADDGKGGWMFNMMRSVDTSMNRARGIGNLEGYKCVKSTQISGTRGKLASPDTAHTLTYILGGDFADLIIAMGGVIEFFTANQGGTEVKNDQTLIRGLQYVDGGVRREASFVKCDNLLIA